MAQAKCPLLVLKNDSLSTFNSNLIGWPLFVFATFKALLSEQGGDELSPLSQGAGLIRETVCIASSELLFAYPGSLDTAGRPRESRPLMITQAVWRDFLEAVWRRHHGREEVESRKQKLMEFMLQSSARVQAPSETLFHTCKSLLFLFSLFKKTLFF